MKWRDELIGRIVLGRYRVVHRLAKGGMGVVYLGRQEGAAGFAKPVVIKHMITEIADEQMERMFVREARILSRLQHSGVVGVLDFGREDGAYLLVMEYVHGYHLGRWSRYWRDTRGPMPSTLAVHIIIHVLDALHYAHTRKRPDGEQLGIVHRDVSPSNVFLDEEGHVKLLDFGIARASGDDEEYKTQDTTVKGKLAYLPPEMFHGEPATARTDIYSCGVVLHELLVGKNEFRGTEMSDTLKLVLTHRATRLRGVRDDVSERLDDIIARALSKDSAERFPDADAFAQALRDVRGMSEDEADSALAREVARDFHGDMPERLKIPALAELDDAWRNPPRLDPRLSTDPPAAMPSQPPTTALASHELPPQRKRGIPWPAAVAVVLLAGGAAAVFALRRDPASGPELVVIQQTTSRADAPPEAAAAGSGLGEALGGDAGDGETEGAAGDPGAEDTETGTKRPTRPTRPPRGGGADALTRAFSRESGRIEACFGQHTQDLSGQPRLEVRFSIDPSGSVRSAELLPASVGGTALGQCILRVARNTSFPARDQPATFRIPIVARRAN